MLKKLMEASEACVRSWSLLEVEEIPGAKAWLYCA